MNPAVASHRTTRPLFLQEPDALRSMPCSPPSPYTRTRAVVAMPWPCPACTLKDTAQGCTLLAPLAPHGRYTHTTSFCRTPCGQPLNHTHAHRRDTSGLLAIPSSRSTLTLFWPLLCTTTNPSRRRGPGTLAFRMRACTKAPPGHHDPCTTSSWLCHGHEHPGRALSSPLSPRCVPAMPNAYASMLRPCSAQ